VKGHVSVTGTAVKGSRNITRVQVRIDSGQWNDAEGTEIWSFSVDTGKIKDGAHTLEGRALDGTDYSDAVKVSFRVDNRVRETLTIESALPLFVALFVVMAALGVTYYIYRRRKGREPQQPAERPPLQPPMPLPWQPPYQPYQQPPMQSFQQPPEGIPLVPTQPVSPPLYRR